jgi:hypothetical protein
MKRFWGLILVFGFAASGWAQVGGDELDIEAEVNAVEPASPVNQSTGKANFEDEEERQSQYLKNTQTEEVVSEDRSINRFPKDNPLFRKPLGPKQGGAVRIEHPRAAEGLIRINKDGSYQYRTKVKAKSKSSSLKFASMSPPRIETGDSNLNFETMYGTNNMVGLEFDYEWQPFRSFGSLGLRMGTGISTAQASGFFKNPSPSGARAEESYTLYLVPLSLMAIYRFEYSRGQWLVPFINGGATYYSLAEVRDDGKAPVFAGAFAVGGGGGLLFSISRLDPSGAYTLSQEYGIADMWLVLEAKAQQGLRSDIDFTNTAISAGIAVDF